VLLGDESHRVGQAEGEASAVRRQCLASQFEGEFVITELGAVICPLSKYAF